MDARTIVRDVAVIAMVAWSCRWAAWPLGAAESTGSEVAAQKPTKVIDDHFLESPVPSPLPGFRAYDGTWRVSDGVLYAEPAAGSKLIADEPVLAAGEVACEILFPDDRQGSAGLIVKVGRPGIGADAFDGYEVALDPHDQCLRLGRHLQNFQLISDVPCAVPVNRWIALVVRMSETRLDIAVDGKLVLEYEDTQQPIREGTFGFRPWMRSVQFRNLSVVAEGKRQSLPFVGPRPDTSQLCCGWVAVERGAAEGQFTVVPRQRENGAGYLQQVSFVAGQGEVGIQRQEDGPDWHLSAGEAYRGYAEVRCTQPTDLYVALESSEGAVVAESRLPAAGEGWQRLAFALTSTVEANRAALVLKLKAPGVFQVRRVWCEPTDVGWPATLSINNLPPIAFIARHALNAPPAVGQDLWAAQPRARLQHPHPGCQPARTAPQDHFQ